MPMPTGPAGPHNNADVTFASMMIEHHKGAIAMADLAPSRADSDQVKQLAAKIKAAQAPEIDQMSDWLAAWAPDTDMNGMPLTKTSASPTSSDMGSMPGMDHGTGHGDTGGSASSGAAMPGMMTEQQMQQLTAAKGAAFDKLFLQMMIAHHQGAIDMAKTEQADGANPSALKLANSIITSQTAEITTMQDLLKTL
ncbi:hypothetical protein GCM10011594_43410 [Nakamurella endophytica]|uniref:DUF305 domain-containing protein n=2 Tax=Nakamurella endophytica TaxID=1748367 RepID=A0A917TDU1_9ACTN|nr:hypothetical protein GCM10011594_43410 [Nakamurella endophytica]